MQGSAHQGKITWLRAVGFKAVITNSLCQCDETKPICQRCTKSRRICQDANAVKQDSFLIHLENSFASGKVKRPRGPRSSIAALRPHFDLQTRAVAYYVQHHLQTLDDVPGLLKGLTDCIPMWAKSGRSCLMVDLALSSYALVVFSRTQRYLPAAEEASSRYYQLLGVAQEQIAQLVAPTLEESNIESCLLAVSLMSRYEGATISPGSLKSMDLFTSFQRWSHYDGAKAILKLWNDNFSDNLPTAIVTQTRRDLIKSSLLRSVPLPDWIQDGSRFGEHGLELDYDRILVRAINLHHAATSDQQKNNLQNSRAETLNNEARELDEALQKWSYHISGACAYQRHVATSPTGWPTAHFYSSIVYSYPKPAYASAWSQYFAIRMVINSTRYKVLELGRTSPLIEPTYEQQRQESIVLLKAMSDNLAASIPFCVERFKVHTTAIGQPSIAINTNGGIKPYLARLIVWPLLIACGVEGIDINQQMWFKYELGSLGRLTGDGVFECAEAISGRITPARVA